MYYCIILVRVLIKFLLITKAWINMKDVRDQKTLARFILLIICLLIYSITGMYEKYNLILLVVLAAVAGVAIHYVVEFAFYIYIKIKGDKLFNNLMLYIVSTQEKTRFKKHKHKEK